MEEREGGDWEGGDWDEGDSDGGGGDRVGEGDICSVSFFFFFILPLLDADGN